MFSMSAFHKEYETDVSSLAVGDQVFKFFVPKSLDPFLDKEDVFKEFPLWSKIWEASIVLANYMAAMPVDPRSGTCWKSVAASVSRGSSPPVASIGSP
jgi:hypothetical protein